MRNIKLYREFKVNTPYIESRMQELSDLVTNMKQNFEYNIIDNILSIVFINIDIIFDTESLILWIDDEELNVNSIEEGIDIIEKKIYTILKVSENKY